MTSAALIIDRAKQSGVVLERHGGRLTWRSQTTPDPSLIALCKSHKAALLQALPDAKIAPAPAPAAASMIDLAAFHERAAIMEYDGGMSRLEAEDAAAREIGFETAESLYRAVIEAWRSAIVALPQKLPPGFDKLKDASLRFLASDWPMKALAAGWDEVALFGVHECAAPRERLDAQGLVPLITWGVLGCTILGLDRHAAALRTQQGSTLHQPRIKPNFDLAVPWRAHSTLTHGERS